MRLKAQDTKNSGNSHPQPPDGPSADSSPTPQKRDFRRISEVDKFVSADGAPSPKNSLYLQNDKTKKLENNDTSQCIIRTTGKQPREELVRTA